MTSVAPPAQAPSARGRSLLARAAPLLAAIALLAVAGLAALAVLQRRNLRALRAQVDELEGRVPDQGAVMTIEAFQFSNLWFALQAENWPLAEFLLNESRKDLRWAIRLKPLRKDAAGHDVNVAAIADAVDGSQMAPLGDALRAHDRPRAEKLYKQTLAGCHACHESASRGFLRPGIPVAPPNTILSFAPDAELPE